VLAAKEADRSQAVKDCTIPRAGKADAGL
jgi:hypothetical protein